MLGVSLTKQGVLDLKKPDFYFMKKPVFSDVLCQNFITLGPEMISTREKMFVSKSYESLKNKLRKLLIDPIPLSYLLKFTCLSLQMLRL